MSAAPSWPLIIVALDGRTFRGTTAIAPGLNFRSILRAPSPDFRGQSPDFVLQTFKTQNDARGAVGRTRPSKPSSSRTAKARNCLSHNGLRRNTRRYRLKPYFRAVSPIWDDNYGTSRVR